MKDYYYILGIKREAQSAEIKKAYQRLCNKFHPDKNQGDAYFESIFKEVKEAYQVLSDEKLRAIYDSDYQQFFLAQAPQAVPETDLDAQLKAQVMAEAINTQRQMKKRQFKKRNKSYAGRVLWFLILLSLLAAAVYYYQHRPRAHIEWSSSISSL